MKKKKLLSRIAEDNNKYVKSVFIYKEKQKK